MEARTGTLVQMNAASATAPDSGTIKMSPPVSWETPVNTSVEPATSLPLEFSLGQNYSNPFNPATTIQFSIASQSRVRLDLFNLLGQRVSTVVDEERPAGSYSERLDGTLLPSGVYFYRLTAGTFTDTKRLVLLK